MIKEKMRASSSLYRAQTSTQESLKDREHAAMEWLGYSLNKTILAMGLHMKAHGGRVQAIFLDCAN